MARYLAKYVASPPIAVRRIGAYTGSHVTYWYQDHTTQARKVETVDAFTCIGRMVQHIFPKGFQRVRYYGLQATKTFTLWCDTIKAGMKRIGRIVQGAYQVVTGKKTYRERYCEGSGRDPLTCRICGAELDLVKRWHPKRGAFSDELENIKQGKYERLCLSTACEQQNTQGSTASLQLGLFPQMG